MKIAKFLEEGDIIYKLDIENLTHTEHVIKHIVRCSGRYEDHLRIKIDDNRNTYLIIDENKDLYRENNACYVTTESRLGEIKFIYERSKARKCVDEAQNLYEMIKKNRKYFWNDEKSELRSLITGILREIN